MASTAHENYVSNHGNHYAFTYEMTGGMWRVYVDRQPNYGYRATDSYSTHRYGISIRPYICWTQPLKTRKDAEAIAHLWANGTDTYIATGSFPRSPGPTNWFARLANWLGM